MPVPCSKIILIVTCLVTLGIKSQSQTKDFNLKIANYRGSLQWEQSSDNKSWSSIPGATSSNFVTQPSKTTYYRAKITEAGCSPVYSDVKAAYVDIYKTLPAKLAKGKVITGTDLSKLSVFSIIDSAGIKPDGSFEVLVADSTKEDLLLVVNKDGDVVMMAHYINVVSEYQINDSSTALAMLITFPFLRPLEISEKPAFINLYKQEPEFNQMVTEVARLSNQGKNIFSLANTELVRLMRLLVKKNFNEDRFRVNRNTVYDKPIEISSFGTSVTLTNTAEHIYSAEIFRKADNSLVDRFTLYGSSMEESFTKQLVASAIYGTTDVKKSRTFDLKAKGYNPGEYEIRLWSGLLKDDNTANRIAAKENFLDLVYQVLCSVIPNPADWIKDECLKAVLDAQLSVINPENMAKAGRDNTILSDYLKPIFEEYSSTLYTLGKPECLNLNTSKFLNSAFKSIEIAISIYSDTKFYASWLFSPYILEACEYVNQYSQTSTCFVVIPISNTNAGYYTGDSTEIKIKTIINEDYYPNESGVIPNAEFVWTAWKGGGYFNNNKDRGQVFLPDKTDASGFATTHWIFTCNVGENIARAGIYGVPVDQEKDLFTTATYIPQAKTFHLGNNQTGMPSQQLPERLRIQYLDKLDGLPMWTTRFTISWANIKGTGTIDKAFSTALDSNFYWTLGPEPGEQIMQATITSKDCNWPIDNNVILFKANKPVQKSVVIISGNNQEGAPNTYLTDFLVVKVLDESGNPISGVTVEWSIVSGGGSLEILTAVTDNDGLAKTKWKLGSTGVQQARAIVKKPDGTEVSGSPALFTSNFLPRTGITVVSGYGQPNDVFVDNNQNLYITVNSQVLKVNLITQSVQIIMQNLQVGSIWVDANDNVYVSAIVPVVGQSSSDEYRIYKLNQSTGTSTIVVAGLLGSNANQFSAMDDIYVDNAGNIYIADKHNHRIQKWQSGGTSGQTVAGTGIRGSDPEQLSSPGGVYFDKNGNMYVADLGNNRVQKSTSGGWVTIGTANAPNGIYVDDNGNVYVSELGSHSVRKISANGQATIVAGGNGLGSAANQLYLPCGIYLDKEGNIYIADKVNARVQKWGPY